MFLGVDLGTSSIKILLSDGTGFDSASANYPLAMPHLNWSEQNPEDWWKGFCACIKSLASRHDITKVKAVSFSGQMHGLVALDKLGNVIRPSILWNDGRTEKQCDYLNNEVGRDFLIEKTANVALTGFTAPKILWLKENEPNNFAKIDKIMLPKDYLVFRLTNKVCTDVSDASGTLLFDVKNRKWSREMLDVVGLKHSQLPDVLESVDVVAKIDERQADELGLPQDCKIVIGGGDQAMGAIGVGAVERGAVSINLGTSGVVFVNTGDFIPDKNASMHSFCNACSSWHKMGVTLSCAGSTKWWVEDVLHQTDYKNVLADISSLPISEVLFLPYLMGERSPINDPKAKGQFFALNAANGQKDLTKAVVEGVCFSLKDCLNASLLTPKQARVIGGGSKSNDWLQILSSVTGLTLKRINTNEGGALGAIILAMTACGDFSSIEEGCRALICETASFTPEKDKFEAYAEKFARYKRLYQRLRDFS